MPSANIAQLIALWDKDRDTAVIEILSYDSVVLAYAVAEMTAGLLLRDYKNNSNDGLEFVKHLKRLTVHVQK